MHLHPSNLLQFSVRPFKPQQAPSRLAVGDRPKVALAPDFHPQCVLPEVEPRSALVSHTNCKNLKSVVVPVRGLPSLPTKKQFTRRGRLAILDAGGALEREGIPSDNFYFVTCTLPGSTSRAMEMMSRFSRYSLNVLKQYLRDRYNVYLTLNCWEWQKRGALHLHLIFVWDAASSPRKLDKIGENIREKWLDILGHIEKKTGVNMYKRNKGDHGIGFLSQFKNTFAKLFGVNSKKIQVPLLIFLNM